MIIMATAGKIIICKAAVSWGPKEPLVFEDIEVDPPKKGEVRIKIAASGVCRTDLTTRNGNFIVQNYPVVLGIEGSGTVESTGEGVTSLIPGDHVLFSSVPQCKDCRVCQTQGKNNCNKTSQQYTGLMTDGTSRFRCQGKSLYHFLGVSSFSQYSVMNAWSVAKVNRKAPLEKICLLSNGISTGYGAVVNTAKVRKGSSCIVWGLGCVGVSVIMGCREAGASKIIGVDVNPAKEKLARSLGMTDFINPSDESRPIAEVVAEMTDGGADYSFECIGTIKTQIDAFESTHPAVGITTLIGTGHADDRLNFRPVLLIRGKTLRGTLLGGWKVQDDFPNLVEKYLKKELEVDKLITEVLPLKDIERSFPAIENGTVCRTVLTMN